MLGSLVVNINIDSQPLIYSPSSPKNPADESHHCTHHLPALGVGHSAALARTKAKKHGKKTSGSRR